MIRRFLRHWPSRAVIPSVWSPGTTLAMKFRTLAIGLGAGAIALLLVVCLVNSLSAGGVQVGASQGGGGASMLFHRGFLLQRCEVPAWAPPVPSYLPDTPLASRFVQPTVSLIAAVIAAWLLALPTQRAAR